MCHVCLPYEIFQEENFNIIVRIGTLRLSHFLLIYLFSVVPNVWPVLGFISVPGIYVETYVYDDAYVQLLITSYLRQKSHHVR